MTEEPGDRLKKFMVAGIDEEGHPINPIDLTPDLPGGDIQIEEREGGKGPIITVNGVSFQKALLFRLRMLLDYPNLSPGVKEVIREIYDFIDQNIKGLIIKQKEDIFQVEVNWTSRADGVTDEYIKEALNNHIVGFCTAQLNGREEEFLKRSNETGDPIPDFYRVSGHLQDQILKRAPILGGAKDKAQLELWNSTTPEIRDEAQDPTVLIEGLPLTPGEHKLIDTINILLHKKSTNTTQRKEKDTYYSGSEGGEIVPYGAGGRAMAPVIKFKPSELYTEFVGGKRRPNGDEIKEINRLLQGLLDKKFLFRYDRVHPTDKNRIQRIEVYKPLLESANFYDLLKSEATKIDQGDQELKEEKRELIIQLHPIFKDQIETKSIKYPMDINKRMLIAQGGGTRPQQSTYILRDYLLRELSSKRERVEMNFETLISQLGLAGYLRAKRRKLIEQNIKKAIEVNERLGLLIRAEDTTGARGQRKFIFYINPGFIER